MSVPNRVFRPTGVIWADMCVSCQRSASTVAESLIVI